jgi:hypothetical protein
LYQINPVEEPPSNKELAEALWRACKDNIVYCLKGHNHSKAQQKLKSATPGEPQTAWAVAEKWLHALQPFIRETENSLKSSSSMIVHNASEQPLPQRIEENGSSDTGQLVLAIAGKTQPEQKPHTDQKHPHYWQCRHTSKD